MVPLFLRLQLFLLRTAVGSYYDTHAHTHAHEPTGRSTVRGCHKGKSLKARPLYRGCLAFGSCCPTSKTAGEKAKNEKTHTFWGVSIGLVARKAILRLLLARFRDFERPEQGSRSPAGTHTCAVVCRRGAFVSRSREREKKTRGRKRKVFVFRRKCVLTVTM